MSARKGKRIVRRRTAPTESPSLDYTLKQAFDYFVSVKKAEGVRERTVEDYYKVMRFFSGWLGGMDTPVNDITTGVIRDYVLFLTEEHVNERTGEIGLSPHTVNIRIRFLRTFFNLLHREEIVDKNPADNVKQMRADHDTYEPMTDAEVDRLLSVMDVKEYAQFRDLVMTYLILDTGMRVNEVCHLEGADIDFKDKTIYLPASKNKNRKPRVIPLSNKTIRLLLELITENRQNFDSDYVFLSNYGERYLPNSYRRRLHIHKESAGIERRITPHSLRHLFCRNYILSGGDVFSLQRIVGHQDISTTRKYTEMTREDLQTQHSQFSPVLRLRHKYKRR